MLFFRRNKKSFEIRRIADLYRYSDKIYFYLANSETRKRFMNNAAKEGFHFGDGTKPTENTHADFIAIFENKRLCFVGWAGHMLVASLGYENARNPKLPRSKTDRPLCIDYERYLNGETDFLYKKY